MTDAITNRSAPSRRAILGLAASAAGLSLAGCVSSPVPVTVPSAQTIEGLAPSGRVTMTQTFVAGVGVGKGVLTFQGKTYPFKLAGTVVGPGSLSRVEVEGDVYRLKNVAEFTGIYTEGTGPIGLQTSGRSNLFLENAAGVVMHLTGKTTGVTLSLGRDEIVIEFLP
jgi:hypothetical protein